MGQQEIYDFLRKYKSKWYNSKEVCRRLDVSIASATTSLKKLRETNVIHFKRDPHRTNAFLYKFK
ncbi:adhesin biosynthesis transcription regulatory family protein [Candidatus Woesearchaeota archaeon]|nr:adhesin biosynthesis transcription regulatory family protein [Candidatus Woesearchaeota archaeon]